MLEQINHWISGLDRFELGLLIYFLGLGILWVLLSDNKANGKKFKSFLWVRPNYLMAVNKKKFVQEVVRWGLTYMKYDGAGKIKNKKVNLEVSYYNHKKKYGVYYSYSNKIKVYVNAHHKIHDVIDTSLHEVVHYLQYCSDPKNFDNKYKSLLDKCTYEKHPMEIEARVIAANHVKPCLNYLIESGYLKKSA
jgi:hypothetical protein